MRPVILSILFLFLGLWTQCSDSSTKGSPQKAGPYPGIETIRSGDSARTVYDKIKESERIQFANKADSLDYSQWSRTAEVNLFDRAFNIRFFFNEQDRLYRITLSTVLGNAADQIDLKVLEPFVRAVIDSYSRKYGNPYYLYSEIALPRYKEGSFYTAKWRLFDNRFSITQSIFDGDSYEFVISIVDDNEMFGVIVRDPRREQKKEEREKDHDRRNAENSRDII